MENVCDIGVNLLDDMYQGIYNGKKYHEPDVIEVLDRAEKYGISPCFITAGMLNECTQALSLVSELRSNGHSVFFTVGVHPTRCNAFLEKDNLISELEIIIEDGLREHTIVAIGECGLDYDRVNFCDKETQLIGFRKQLEMSSKYSLPLFLHNRNTCGDFVEVLRNHVAQSTCCGVVHSFDGTLEEMNELISLGFYIGINGCSLKTEENLHVASQIPLNRLLVESDGPWCGIKKTHAGYGRIVTHFPVVKKDKSDRKSMIKDRSEPCSVIQVIEVLAGLFSMEIRELRHQLAENTRSLFPMIVNDKK